MSDTSEQPGHNFSARSLLRTMAPEATSTIITAEGIWCRTASRSACASVSFSALSRAAKALRSSRSLVCRSRLCRFLSSRRSDIRRLTVLATGLYRYLTTSVYSFRKLFGEILSRRGRYEESAQPNYHEG